MKKCGIQLIFYPKNQAFLGISHREFEFKMTNDISLQFQVV